MLPKISKIKGIHPGAILKRELKTLGIRSNEFAELVNEHKQTISAIINEKRGINPALSIKLAKQLHVADDYFMYLQSSYDVKSELKKFIKSNGTPNLSLFRKILFWDTDFDNIDWEIQKSAIILRVFERGNELEINEIISFYGRQNVKRLANLNKNHFHAIFYENVRKYL